MTVIDTYQKVRLKDGRYARIVEVLEAGIAFLADIYDGKGDYDHEEIAYSDISAIVTEVEQPLVNA